MDPAYDLYASRVAMTINNIAVTMLERGSLKESLKTLKDSVVIMRSLMDPANDKNNATSPRTPAQDVEIDERLQVAVQRLVKCEKKAALSHGSYRVTQVSPLDDVDVMSMKSALRYGPSFTMAFPIRLRSIAVTGEELDFQAGVVLYNMGLVHTLAHSQSASSSSTSSRTPSPMLAGALKYLQLAHHVLAGFFEENQDDYQTLCAMLVDSLALSNLFGVLQYKDELPKARQVLACMDVLEAAVQEHDHVGCFLDIVVSPAT